MQGLAALPAFRVYLIAEAVAAAGEKYC